MDQHGNTATDLMARLGLPELPEAAQSDLLEELGEIAFESALLRFVSEHPEAADALESSLSELPESETNFADLAAQHPIFFHYLEEEIASVQNQLRLATQIAEGQ